MPGDEDRQQLAARRAGATSQRRSTTTLVMTARARPPYRPLDLSAISGRLVEYRTLSVVTPIASTAIATRSTRRLEPAARIREHERDQDHEEVSSSARATSDRIGMPTPSNVPMNHVSPTAVIRRPVRFAGSWSQIARPP